MENKGSDCQGTIRNPAEMITISSFTCFLFVFLGFPGVKEYSEYSILEVLQCLANQNGHICINKNQRNVFTIQINENSSNPNGRAVMHTYTYRVVPLNENREYLFALVGSCNTV